MDSFFGIYIDASGVGGMTFALLLSVVLSGLIGLEREIHGHPAGLRTHILVCVGSTLVTLVSKLFFKGTVTAESDRIAAQIVSGIGFLGAGAIIREGATVRGLTTAASIWTTAGIGIAIGAGPFFGELAVITTIIVLFTLWVLDYVEDWIVLRTRRPFILALEVHDTPRATAEVIARISSFNADILAVDFEPIAERHLKQVTLRLKLPEGCNRNDLMKHIAEDEHVAHVHFQD
jgi:putative Mg2+ transporter-C (MgtC) family protein